MKQLILILMLFGAITQVTYYAQSLTEEQKQQYISGLADSTKWESSMRKIARYKIKEAIPAIITYLWQQEPYNQIGAITALSNLHYEGSKDLVYQYLSRVGTYNLEQSAFNITELKGFAATCLIALGDYSQNQLLYDSINLRNKVRYLSVIHDLGEILKNYPPDKEIVTTLLKKASVIYTNNVDRLAALEELYEYYGEEIIPYLIERVENDNDKYIKDELLGMIIWEDRSKTAHNYLLNTIFTKDNKDLTAGVLLRNWGTPIDLKTARKIIADGFDITNHVDWAINEDDFVYDQISRIQNTVILLDSLISFHNQCFSFNWLGNIAFSDQLKTYLTEAKTKLTSGDSLGAALKIKLYQNQITEQFKDTLTTDGKYVTEDGYKFLYYYPKYILERLPKLPTVKFSDSQGKLINSGSLQYYEGSWKDAVSNNDGTFTVPTTQKTLSLRMNYAFGSQTKSNVTVGADTIVFQTVSAQVKLLDSKGAILDTGTVQYYSGAWRDFGSTTNGVAIKELLPNNYSFRMTYAFASRDKAQDISANNVVVFQTVPATVQLKNSLGNLIDAGTVQYYSGAWRDFGSTTNGVAVKELLPNNYSFRMNYMFGSRDKAQDISTNNVVVFQTVPATVQLKNSSGNLIDAGTVQYYSGAWRDFGSTTNGVAVKELLPNNYSFRMNYMFGSRDKAQDISTNNVVVFQTVPATVQLKNSSGNLIDAGTVQYYSGAWRDFGVTANGVAVKELLPNNYSFRMNFAFASKDKTQDVGTNNTVVFQTVSVTVQLKNSSGELMDAGTVQYYSGAWRDFGSTTNGVVVKELLPNNYSFRMNFAFSSKDKAQDISTNNVVLFQTVPATVQLKNSGGELMDAGTVQYYSGAWRDFGATTNGVVVKELLPNNYSFRMNYAFASKDKAQDVGTNNTVVFQTVPATVQLKNSGGELMDAGTVQYYSGAWRDFGATTNGVAVKELLPNNYSFRMNYAFASKDKAQDISANNIVVFQTVPATVQLKNSSGNLIDAGTVQYYSGAWREFGVTANGVAVKELLPNNYSFRMTHEFVSLDKAQNTETNNVVVFNTVLCNVNVLDAQNQPVNNAAVSYYSGAWRNIGATLNGTISKELLPVNLSFRAVSGTKQIDKTQNIGVNNNVEIKLP